MRKSFWGLLASSDPPPALTKHPYRHAAITHGVLAVVILGFGWATSAHVGRTVLMALGYFAIATSWTWWHYRERKRREAGEVEAE